MRTIPAGKRWDFSEGAEAGLAGRREQAGIGLSRNRNTDPPGSSDSVPERRPGADGPSASDGSRRCGAMPRPRVVAEVRIQALFQQPCPLRQRLAAQAGLQRLEIEAVGRARGYEPRELLLERRGELLCADFFWELLT